MNIDISLVTPNTYPEYMVLLGTQKETIDTRFHQGDVVFDKINQCNDIVLGQIGTQMMRTLDGVRIIDDFVLMTAQTIVKLSKPELDRAIKNNILFDKVINYNEYMNDMHLESEWIELANASYLYLLSTAKHPLCMVDAKHLRDMFLMFYASMKNNYADIKKVNSAACDLYDALVNGYFTVVSIEDIYTFLNEVFG